MREHPIIFSAPMVRAILEGRKMQTRRVVRGGQPKGVGTFHVDTGFKGGRPTLVETTPHPAGREIHWLQRMPYGQPGDRLWVRETWNIAFRDDLAPDEQFGKSKDECIRDNHGFGAACAHGVVYAATNALEHPVFGKALWRPSIHMPRWASRITLEITDVRVQRVQDISEEDAIAEGCAARPFPGPWWQGYRDIDGDLIHQEAVGEFPPDWMIEPHRMRDLSHLDVSARDAFRNLWDSINEKRGFGWNANPWVWALTFKRLEQSQ